MRLVFLSAVAFVLFPLFDLHAQQSCATPIIVPPNLTYNATGLTTCGQGNTIDSTALGCALIDITGGEEIVFKISPVIDGFIDVVVKNPSIGGATMQVTHGCPNDAGAVCLDDDPSIQLAGDSLTNLPVHAGQDYYLALGRAACFTFDIEIRPSTGITGSSFAKPQTITLPFGGLGLTTCGFGDDYRAAVVCNEFGNNFSREDRVFRYVASGPECISISLTNLSDSVRPGLNIMRNSSPYDPLMECVAGADFDDAGADCHFSAFLPAADTYFILLGSNGSPDCFSFDLSITSSQGDLAGKSCAEPYQMILPFEHQNASTCCSPMDQESMFGCGSSSDSRQVWYEYVASGPQCFVAEIANTSDHSGFDLLVTDLCPDDSAANCVSASYFGDKGGIVESYLPAAGSYYVQLQALGGATCGKYDFLAKLEDTNTGTHCSTAVSIPSIPFVENHATNCCVPNTWPLTLQCFLPVSSYMGGNVKTYEYVSAGNECLTFTIPDGSVPYGADFGMVLSAGCPLNNAAALNAASIENTSNENEGLSFSYSFSQPGTYYLLIGARTSTHCFSYDLEITGEALNTGNSCASAIPIGPLPFQANAQSLCCRPITPISNSAYHNDGVPFLGNSAAVYSYTSTGNECVAFTIEGNHVPGFTDVGMWVVPSCPLDSFAVPLQSHFFNTGIDGHGYSFTHYFPSAATYYIMVSSPPSVPCWQFDLTAEQQSTPCTDCPVPTGLRTLNNQPTKVVLDWEAVPGANAYKIRYKEAGTSIWNTVWKAGPGSSRLLTGLTPGTTYKWKVRAKCQSGWSPDQQMHTFITLTEPCDVPNGISVAPIQSSQVRLNWNPDTNVSFFRIQYRELGNTNWTSLSRDGIHSHIWLTNLAASTTYQYRMKAICHPAAGSGTRWSQIGYFTTEQAPKRAPSTAVLNSSVEATVFPNPFQNEITVAWADVPPEECTITLLDISGRIVTHRVAGLEPVVQLRVQDLPAGLYLLTIDTRSGKQVVRLVAQ